MPSPIKLILIDGHALIHRAFHAIRAPMTAKDGTPTNALYGFVSMFLRLITEQQPTHIIACLDAGGKTFRHECFSDYKATRQKTDPNLHLQVPLVMQFLEAWPVPVFAKEGWEADDLLGTLATQAQKQNINTIIFTGDRDMTQLISKQVSVYTPQNNGYIKKWTSIEVQEYFGVKPDQIVDYKALAGDSSDNIPGVLGIGPKGAAELLSIFGSLENIYANINQVKSTFQSKLIEHKDSAFMSFNLAQIKLDAPVEFEIAKSEAKCEPEKVDAFFESIGFQTLRRRFDEMIGIAPKEIPIKTRKKVSEEQMSLF
ncbi:MAG: hypothetical protein NTZ80_04555 [Patescibacteria group bacterium]|nr:hypothetical protein [Patescibacteria group bacterium]